MRIRASEALEVSRRWVCVGVWYGHPSLVGLLALDLVGTRLGPDAATKAETPTVTLPALHLVASCPEPTSNWPGPLSACDETAQRQRAVSVGQS